MNGVHDLGGTDGLGRRPGPASEPVYRAEWEKAAFGMFSMPFRAGFFGVDAFRFGIEQMHPAAYLLSPYYEHWAHTVRALRRGQGRARRGRDRRAHAVLPGEPGRADAAARRPADLIAFVDGVVKAGAPAARPSDKPAKFSVGDRVTVDRRRPARPHPQGPLRARQDRRRRAGARRR